MIAFHRLRLICTCLLIVVATGDCRSKVKSDRVSNFLGDRAGRILEAVDRVEIFRIEERLEKSHDQAASFAGYRLVATAKEQDRAYASRLAAVLRDDGIYDWNIVKQCIFSPGIGYRIWSGKNSIVVLICFQCDEVGVISDEGKPRLRTQSADRGRNALLKLAREVFPDDMTLQSLKD